MTKFKFQQQNVSNTDGIGSSTFQDSENIIALKGRKRVDAVTSW